MTALAYLPPIHTAHPEAAFDVVDAAAARDYDGPGVALLRHGESVELWHEGQFRGWVMAVRLTPIYGDSDVPMEHLTEIDYVPAFPLSDTIERPRRPQDAPTSKEPPK
jgi:hypothetical protein